MKAKYAKSFLNNLATVAALYFSFTEVRFPWSISTALLGYLYFTWSAMTWESVLRPRKSTLSGGVIHYVGFVVTCTALTSIPLLLILATPGPMPRGILDIASGYAFIKTILFDGSEEISQG